MRKLILPIILFAISAALNAQASLTVVPSYIVPGVQCAIIVHDPAAAGEIVTVRVYDLIGGQPGPFENLLVQLDENGDGLVIWDGDVIGWNSLIATFRYIDKEGGFHYEHRPIVP